MNAPAPPSKKKRAGQVVPTSPNDFGLVDHTPLVCGAQDECEHSETRIEVLPPGSYHFAKERCTNCDRVLRFLPKPQPCLCETPLARWVRSRRGSEADQ
jgi:hypothetical protein